MPTPQELETKFWNALKSDMTMMLGLDGVEDGHARPMTAQSMASAARSGSSQQRTTRSCNGSGRQSCHCYILVERARPIRNRARQPPTR